MKMTNEEEKMKIFSVWPKMSNLYFLEYLNFADSKTVLRFYSYTPSKWVHFGHFNLSLEGWNF